MIVTALNVRKSLLAAAALTLGAGILCSSALRADDMKMDDKSAMTTEDHTAMTQQVDKMKQMAADPQQAEQMKSEMAKMMVMDHMAEKMCMDSDCKKATMDAMNDPAVKKVHDDAKAMAQDPEQMKKLKEEIMADPMAMKAVMHEAMMMSMMHDKSEGMGGKMMDKMDNKMGDSK